MTVEMLEDWQLALAELFAQERDERPLQIVFRPTSQCLTLRFGPASPELVSELAKEGAGVGLWRILSTLSDRLEVETSEDGPWIVLRRFVSHTNDAA